MVNDIANIVDHFFQNCAKIFDNFKAWSIVKRKYFQLKVIDFVLPLILSF